MQVLIYRQIVEYINFVSVHVSLDLSHLCKLVEWLERLDCERHGLGSKPTRAFLLCPSERHFTVLSPAW